MSEIGRKLIGNHRFQHVFNRFLTGSVIGFQWPFDGNFDGDGDGDGNYKSR